MSGKTKIVVFHKKNLIYAGILILLGILAVLFLYNLPSPGEKTTSAPAHSRRAGGEAKNQPGIYIPGTYQTTLVLGGQTANVEVTLSEDAIDSIRLADLSDTVLSMYPLLEPTLEQLSDQILEKQSLENITYSTESKFTALVLLEAIRNSVEKGKRQFN